MFTNATGLDDAKMQALAREMSFSETVFLSRSETGHAKLRIFTPVQEIPFAGHPVLGTAFVVGASIQTEEILLETQKGIVPVRLEKEHATPRFGWMQQPLPNVEPFAETAELFAALGVAGSELPVELYDNGARHLYVSLSTREEVARLEPDFARLARVCSLGVSTFAGSGLEWKTRMFAPAAGVNEDPATGSAAGPLAVHLARHDRIAFGDEIRIEQGSEVRRPSTLHARAVGSREKLERVEVGGAAVIVARGEFQLS